MRRLFFRAALACLLLATAAGGALWWKRELVQSRAQAWLVEEWLRYVQPKLPFKVEEVTFRESWRELRAGRISRLGIVASWSGWKLHLEGPIDFIPVEDREEHTVSSVFHEPSRRERFVAWITKWIFPQFGKDLRLDYHARAWVEPVGRPEDRSGSVSLDLGAQVDHALAHIDEASVRARAPIFDWKRFGLKTSAVDVEAHYVHETTLATLNVAVAKLEWAAPGQTDRAVNAAELRLAAEVPVALTPGQPPRIGPRARVSFHGKGAELLFGEFYLDVPLAKLPVAARFEFLESPVPVSAHLEVGAPHPAVLDLRGIFEKGAKPALPRALAVKWKHPALPLPELLAAVKAAGFKLGILDSEIKLTGGTLKTEGDVTVPLHGGPPAGDAAVELLGVNADWRAKKLGARGISLVVPISTRHATQGLISARAVGFRALRGKFDVTGIRLEPKDAGTSFELHLGDSRGIGLRVEKLPVRVGPISGVLRLHGPAEERFDLATSVELTELPIEDLLHDFCVSHGRLPPARVRAGFERIEVTPETVDASGVVTALLFDGTAQLGNFSMSELGSAFPDTSFDVIAHGFRLDLLGDWLGLGEMDGLLDAEAHDVTFQGMLPTNYHVRFAGKPLHRDKIIFSREAMRSTIELISGGALEKLPGFIGRLADFVAFQWKWVGYDVDYMGLDVTSEEGSIILRTLDPPEELEKDKFHYILKGHRVRIPITNTTYPIVMDAHAFTRYMQNFTKELMRRKAAKEPKKNEEHHEADCDSPALD